MVQQSRSMALSPVIGTVRQGGATLVAIAAFIAGMLAPVGNAVDLWNKLHPQPTARIVNMALKGTPPVTYNVTFGSFLTGITPYVDKKLIAQQRQIWEDRYSGVILNLSLDIQGYKGEDCLIRWTVFNAITHEAVHNSTLVAQPAFPLGQMQPSSNEDRRTNEIWIPYPGKPGHYYIQLSIFHDKAVEGNFLDTVDTPAFQTSLVNGVKNATPRA